ncbi:hypothetical protein ZPR_4551 [Zunongwangia profunda SM-A87]|uniref:Uncharacterized protein n=1 Tax=Zunongwangia profunda (strain DSM 18752 / CCTCC AB 206139 / SM-A87) TaxID=655815 RepID=D5BDE5_ZUNPS|nr:hypothetical protein ZPR_4551 [Zunongwangia profunda SM-A87]
MLDFMFFQKKDHLKTHPAAYILIVAVVGIIFLNILNLVYS